MKTCGWCGYVNDCTPEVRGTSLHHGLCCADQRPSVHISDRTMLDRIMREDAEERWGS